MNEYPLAAEGQDGLVFLAPDGSRAVIRLQGELYEVERGKPTWVDMRRKRRPARPLPPREGRLRRAWRALTD